MLGGEHLGGSEQSRLAAGSRHRHHRGGGHHSFSRPHFTLNKPIHGVTTGHVIVNLFHNGELILGQGEGQTLQEGVGLLARNTWRAGHRLGEATSAHQSGLEDKRFVKAQRVPGCLPVRLLRGTVNLLQCLGKPEELLGGSNVLGDGVTKLPQHIQDDTHRFGDLPAGQPGSRGVKRNGAFRPFLTVLRQCILIAKKLIVGVSQLALSPIGTNFSGEHSPSPWSEVFLPPRLIEKGEGDQSGAIRNHHFEDGPALLAHGSLLGGDHLGNQGHLLPQWDTGDRGEFPAAGVAAGVVFQQIAHRGIAKCRGEGFLGAIAQNSLQSGLESDAHPATLSPGKCSSPLALWNDQNHRWGRGLVAPRGSS